METNLVLTDLGGVLAEEGQHPARMKASEIVPKVKSESRLRLSDRDYEIFRFLLEMKFASLDEIYFRFFRKTRDGSESKSSWWARERLALLRKHGFITPVRLYSEPKVYLLPTTNAYRVLRMKSAGGTICKPSHQIDFSQFEHDCNLLWVRLDLEDRGLGSSWRSDRFLGESAEDRKVLGSEYRPDGIFVDSSGVEVAFELEIAPKAKERYRSKILRYVELMRRMDEQRRPFRKVLYVAKYEPVFERLVSMTRMYGPLFEVRRLSGYLVDRIRTAAAIKPSVENAEVV